MAGQGSLCQQAPVAQRVQSAPRFRFAIIVAVAAIASAVGIETSWSQDTAVVPDNLLKIDLEDRFFFEPEAPIQLTVSSETLIPFASQRLSLVVAIYRVTDGEVVATERQILPLDAQGNCEPVAVTFIAPSAPGVYEVRCEIAKDDDNIWKRLRRRKARLGWQGEPIVVAAKSPLDAMQNLAKTRRQVLIDLRQPAALQALIESSDNSDEPQSENETAFDSRTMQAAALWNAVAALREFLVNNHLTGACVPGASDTAAWAEFADLLPVASVDDALADSANIFNQFLLAQGIDTVAGPDSDFTIAMLGDASMQPDSDETKIDWSPEYAIGAAISERDTATLMINHRLEQQHLTNPAKLLLQTFAALPVEPLATIESSDPDNKTVQVRYGVSAGQHHVSILSRAPWNIQVDLEFSQHLDWESAVERPTEGDGAPLLQVNQHHLRLNLAPGELVLLRADDAAADASAGLRRWSSSVTGGGQQIAQIKRDVTLIMERIGLLSDLKPCGALRNGGFEQSGDIGLVGWMHAQHPADCVQIDDQQRVEGARSVLLTTDPAQTSRTWIVSEPMAPPKSGRMAVSMMMRAELKEDATPHKMRVSLEATQAGQPLRYARDFELQRNGQWGSRQIVLEAAGIEKQNVDSLRLTIDSISGGRVWLDDLRVHDWFPSAKEREELHSQAFLAVQGLQRGDLTPSARLLRNPWARYLLTRQPSKSVKPVVPAKSPDKPGVAERIRNWLPRPIRF